MYLIRSALLVALLLAPATNMQAADTSKENFGEEQKKELQGTWTATDTKGFTKDAAKDFQGLHLTFKGDTIAATYGEKTAEATYKLILTKAGPSQIDVTVTQGPKAVQGKTFPAIYLLEGKTLKISYRDPGKPRPADFTDDEEAGISTIFFKKDKK